MSSGDPLTRSIQGNAVQGANVAARKYLLEEGRISLGDVIQNVVAPPPGHHMIKVKRFAWSTTTGNPIPFFDDIRSWIGDDDVKNYYLLVSVVGDVLNSDIATSDDCWFMCQSAAPAYLTYQLMRNFAEINDSTYLWSLVELTEDTVGVDFDCEWAATETHTGYATVILCRHAVTVDNVEAVSS